MLDFLKRADIEDKVIGCIIGGAIGDAIGASVEGMSPSHIKSVAQRRGMKKGINNYIPYKGIIGQYTDDTQLTIIVAESYAKFGKFNPDFFAKELSKWPEYAIGSGRACRESAKRLKRGVSWEKSGDPTSLGNGTAMRSAPIGIYRRNDLKTMAEECKTQSIITHRTNEAIAGSMAVAYAVAYALNHRKISVPSFINSTVKFIYEKDPRMSNKISSIKRLVSTGNGASILGTSGIVDETVASALYYFARSPDNFEASVLNAVNGGGDVDTIAAIVGNISGAHNGYLKIPEQWKNGLVSNSKEPQGKGKEYLIQLAKML